MYAFRKSRLAMKKQKSVLSHFSERKWRVVDATNIPLGRLSSEIAKVLMGKHRPVIAHIQW